MQSENFLDRHSKILRGGCNNFKHFPIHVYNKICGHTHHLLHKTASTKSNNTLHGCQIRSKFKQKYSEPKTFNFKMINIKDWTAIMVEKMTAMILKKYNDKVAEQCVFFSTHLLAGSSKFF